MTITCIRRKGRLPELISNPKFCGAEDEETLTEYAIWRSYIFDTMLDILTDGEIVSIAKSGAQE